MLGALGFNLRDRGVCPINIKSWPFGGGVLQIQLTVSGKRFEWALFWKCPYSHCRAFTGRMGNVKGGLE